MTEKNSRRVLFRFDDGKNHSANCKAFLEATKAEDPEMAAILRANWDALIAIVREGERDSKARVDFNSKIESALDALVDEVPAKPEGGR